MYAKVFSSIFDGSMRGHSDLILVFVNILCHTDQDGICDRHWQAIADETGLPAGRVKLAIAELEGPDEQSRSRNDDGRRLKRIDPDREWGWQVINFMKYDAIRNSAHRREYMRKLMADKRKHKVLAPVSTPLAKLAHADADADADADASTDAEDKRAPAAPRALKPRFEKPTPGQVTEYGNQIGFDVDGQGFVDFYTAKGWMIGKNAMKDWRAAVRTWKKRDTERPGMPPAVQRKPFPGETLKLVTEFRTQEKAYWNRYAVMTSKGEQLPGDRVGEYERIKAKRKEYEGML